MEFFLYNKDDQKSKALVNLATTFKINGINYIVYYNKQGERSTIDIYIGKIGYGDQSLVINKIDPENQQEFLTTIKEILAGTEPETELSDYKNIIDTATIVLDTVQKIQIPSASLENLTKYHNEEVKKEENSVESSNENNEVSTDKITNKASEVNEDDINNYKEDKEYDNSDYAEINNDETKSENELESAAEKSEITNEKKEESQEDSQNNNDSTFISGADKLSDLDNLLNNQKEKEEKKKEKIDKKKDKKPAISGSILLLLILTVVGAIVLYLVANFML